MGVLIVNAFRHAFQRVHPVFPSKKRSIILD